MQYAQDWILDFSASFKIFLTVIPQGFGNNLPILKILRMNIFIIAILQVLA